MKNYLATFTLSSLMLAAGIASAQPRDGISSRASSSSDTVEISVAGSYAQGGGTIDSPDIGHPGGGAEIAVGQRFLDGNLAIGVYGTLNALSADGAEDDVAASSIGAKADWHFVPQGSVDPWVSLGTGAKVQWSGGRDELSGTRLGLELAKAQVGVDFRMTRSFFVAPTIGASATLYTHENTPMTDGYESIDGKKVNLTFSAGLQGRFSFGNQL